MRNNQQHSPKNNRNYEQQEVQACINYNHVLTELQDYMLQPFQKVEPNCQPLGKNNHSGLSSQVVVELAQPFLKVDLAQPFLKVEKVEKVEEFFYPKEKDQLFWCYFIIQHGFSKYEYPGTTSFANEKIEKFKSIEHMRANKQQLKTKKIKNIREDVEDELANKQIIGMKTFIALCIASNINIMYIHNRKCFELIFDDQLSIHVVHCKNNKDSSAFKYCYEITATKEQIDNYRSTLFKWESVDKPLKAISAYKLEELQNLCQQLALEACNDKQTFKNKTKKDLYELLIMKL